MTHFINNIGIYICVDIGIHICEAPKAARVSKLSDGSINCVGDYIAQLSTQEFHYLGLANIKEYLTHSQTLCSLSLTLGPSTPNSIMCYM